MIRVTSEMIISFLFIGNDKKRIKQSLTFESFDFNSVRKIGFKNEFKIVLNLFSLTCFDSLKV